MKHWTSFDEVADLYDRVRPRYPEQLVEDIVALAGITSSSRVLEVGCGTGQATVLFARRGCPILCLEPGKNLARLAARNCAGFPNVRIETAMFEDWTPPGPGTFDLVMSAQAFHWIDPAIRFVKSAQVLRSDGTLALFWNIPQGGGSNRHQAVQAAYARHAPSLADLLSGRQKEAPEEDLIDASGLYGTVVMSRYRWSRTYTAEDYASLMETQSDHRALPPEQRTALLQAVREAIIRHGGAITIDYVTRLYIARKRVV